MVAAVAVATAAVRLIEAEGSASVGRSAGWNSAGIFADLYGPALFCFAVYRAQWGEELSRPGTTLPPKWVFVADMVKLRAFCWHVPDVGGL